MHEFSALSSVFATSATPHDKRATGSYLWRFFLRLNYTHRQCKKNICTAKERVFSYPCVHLISSLARTITQV